MSGIRTAWRLAAGSATILLSLAMPASAQNRAEAAICGTLEIGTVYVTLSALSFDRPTGTEAHHDTGNYLERCSPPTSRSEENGGKYPFYADAYLPSDAIRGELAESWEWKKGPAARRGALRRGIMFPRKTGRDGLARIDCGRRRVQLPRLAKSPKAQNGYFSLSTR